MRILSLFLILISFVINSYADVGVGLGLSPWDSVSKREKVKKNNKIDAFIEILAIHFQENEKELNKLWNRGYGRNELIKLIILSRKSGRELKEIIAQRNKNTRISKISEKYNLNYNEIMAEAITVRKEIDYKLSISTESAVETLLKSTSTAIGENNE